jgi:hypothetical protein
MIAVARWCVIPLVVTVVFASEGSVSGATNWKPILAALSHGQSHGQSQPVAPVTPTDACNATKGEVTITWTAYTHAKTYTLYYYITTTTTTTTPGTFVSYVTGLTTTTYTSVAYSSKERMWYEVEAYVGTYWVSVMSAYTVSYRTISSSGVCS